MQLLRLPCLPTACPALLSHAPPPPVQVPHGYAHPAAPIHLAGAVTSGFGRGSKQLGVPTANLPPEPLAEQLAGLADGVYFGCAALCYAVLCCAALRRAALLAAARNSHPASAGSMACSWRAHRRHAAAAAASACRWAQLEGDDSWPEADRQPHKMVMNIGKAPTFGDAEPKRR